MREISSVFSKLMPVVFVITMLVSFWIYVTEGFSGGLVIIDENVALSAVVWYMIYGHVVSAFIAAIFVGLPLTILVTAVSVVIGGAARLVRA